MGEYVGMLENALSLQYCRKLVENISKILVIYVVIFCYMSISRKMVENVSKILVISRFSRHSRYSSVHQIL